MAVEQSRESHNQRARSVTTRDIGSIPDVVDQSRRDRARGSLQFFLETYFPSVFSLSWSDDHIKVISKAEAAITKGGLYALAMPRGSGKTSICECACLWAILYGYHKFVVLVGSDESSALEMLDSIKSELEHNGLLTEDFPEVCYPIQCLEGLTLRAVGQHLAGQRTQIGWSASELVLPTVAGSVSSGATVKPCGITGRIRGMKAKRPDGTAVRPSLVIIDDPQTDESAHSPSQCDKRERVLAGAVLGLAGPGKKISGIMPCTVVAPHDLASRILDRSTHPDWQGDTSKMVYQWPDRQDLWDQYTEIRCKELEAGGDGSEATEFYRAHRAEMDKGAKVSWADRYNEDELSAIQSAFNLRARDEHAFFSEYQNEPLAILSDTQQITHSLILDNIGGWQRHCPPITAEHVSSFVDVQGEVLYYCTVAWDPNFTGHILDYGTFPEQSTTQFTLAQLKKKLSKLYPGTSLEGRLFAGLKSLLARLLEAEYLREDGVCLSNDRILVDANWGASTETVYGAIRHIGKPSINPSHGKAIGASGQPLTAGQPRSGELQGLHWKLGKPKGRVRPVVYDTNFWKSFMASRLKTPQGQAGHLGLWRDDQRRHRLFASHLCAEYAIPTSGRGRTVDEWKIRPERPDNHWLDCLAGACVAASMAGVKLKEQRQELPKRKRRRGTVAKI